MKPLMVVVFALGTSTLAPAQDKLSRDEAERYAKVCAEALGKPGDGPIGTEVEPGRAVAVRGEGGGAMVIPQKGLMAANLEKIGAEVVPVGQLWLRKWVPVVDGKPVAGDRLRIVSVPADGKDRPMPAILLGVRKKADTGLELVGYANAPEPLLVRPLKTVEFVQELPIDLDWERGEKNVDALTLTLFGKHRTVIPVTRG